MNRLKKKTKQKSEREVLSLQLNKTYGSKAEKQARMFKNTSTLDEFVVHINIMCTFENTGSNVNILS